MSSWCWTPSSLETWRRYIRTRFGHDGQDEAKMPKHKVIAQTWAKRKEFEDKGRLSITLYNTHTDPVGINFDVYDINSSETIEISSTWANYLPKCVKRRMALTLATNSSSQGTRQKSSIDSEISFSVRHVSVESRRNSIDSQVSVKIAEMKTKVASHMSRSSNGHRRHSKRITNNKRAQKYKDFKSDYRHDGRRESTTSVESRVIAVRKSTYPIAGEKMDFFLKSNMSKKHEIDHHKSSSIKNNDNTTTNITAQFIAKNGQLILPFLQNKGTISSSSEGVFYDIEEEKNRYNDIAQRNQCGIQIEEVSDNFKSVQDNNSSSINAKNTSNSTRLHQHNKLNYTHNTKFKNGLSGKKRLHAKKHKLKGLKSSKYKQKYSIDKSNDQRLMNILNLKMSSSHNNSNPIYPLDRSELNQSTSQIDVPLDVMLNSTYSGDSLWKQNSTNSKTSCDVGIQTNDYEMVENFYNDNNQDLEECQRSIKEIEKTGAVLYDRNPNLLQLNTKNRRINFNDEKEAASTETHILLNGANNRLKTSKPVNEAERLKLLLLP